MPGQRLLGIARVHQRKQRVGGVAQPAKAIVPVPRAAELFRQRGGRGRDDAAARLIGQRLQGNQRSQHEFARLAVIGATAAPFGPEILGVLQRGSRVDEIGDGKMRRTIREHERHAFTLAHLEVRHRGQVLAPGLDRRAQHRHVLPADREQRGAVFGPLHPRNIDAEAKTDHQFHPHLHPAADAAHQAHDVGSVTARRHEVDQRDRAPLGLEPRLQDQRVVPIAARVFYDFIGGRDQPTAVLSGAEDRGKAGVGIESRPA